jgi:hypothetical protein
MTFLLFARRNICKPEETGISNRAQGLTPPIPPIVPPYRGMLATESCQNACNDKNDQQALIKMHAFGCENNGAKGSIAPIICKFNKN